MSDLQTIALDALGDDELPASEIAYQFELICQRNAISPSLWRGRAAQVCARVLSELHQQGRITCRRTSTGGLMWRAAQPDEQSAAL